MNQYRNGHLLPLQGDVVDQAIRFPWTVSLETVCRGQGGKFGKVCIHYRDPTRLLSGRTSKAVCTRESSLAGPCPEYSFIIDM